MEVFLCLKPNWGVLCVLYPTAEQGELPCSPALWPVGPVVRQWAPNRPVRPQWVAGPHLRRLWPRLEPAGLQVSSMVCTGLPFTASSSSSSTIKVPLQDRGSESQLWPQEGAVPPPLQPHIPLLPLASPSPERVKKYTQNNLNFNVESLSALCRDHPSSLRVPSKCLSI